MVFACPATVRRQFAQLFLVFGGVPAAERQCYHGDHMRTFMAQDQSRLAWFFYRCQLVRTGLELGQDVLPCPRACDLPVDFALDDLNTSSASESVDDWFPPTEGLE